DDGHNEIFSDRQSMSNYYKRVMNYSFGFVLVSIIISYWLYKDGLYLTDGLWSMTGSLFWKAFLFETPFALFRLLPAFMVILFGVSFYKSYRKYAMLKEK